MLKMGMPEGAVMQKMAVDGVDQYLQDAFTDEVMAAADDRGADPPETAREMSDNRASQKLDPIKPDSVSSFFEEVIDEDEDDGEDVFDEEEVVEEEVVFDDDVDGDRGQHQTHPREYDSSGHAQSFNSQYTEESYYGSTEGDLSVNRLVGSAAATATTDMESQWQQSQQPQTQSSVQQSQQQRNVSFPPQEQAPSSVTPSIEKPLPSPTPMWYWLTCLLLLILIGTAAGVGYYLTIDEDGSAPRVEPNVTEAPTLTPVRVSSEFNPVQGSCDFEDVTYPNPVDQCDCFGSIRDIPADVRRRYEYNRESFISTLYAEFDDDISSCSPRNQALVWVSSGDDEDLTEELRTERYALATIFASLSGTQWNDRTNWLTYGESSPCDWAGVSCSNSAGVVQSLSIDRNNAEGVVSPNCM
jgi:Leucine rich repeat N-terminal domain